MRSRPLPDSPDGGQERAFATSTRRRRGCIVGRVPHAVHALERPVAGVRIAHATAEDRELGELSQERGARREGTAHLDGSHQPERSAAKRWVVLVVAKARATGSACAGRPSTAPGIDGVGGSPISHHELSTEPRRSLDGTLTQLRPGDGDSANRSFHVKHRATSQISEASTVAERFRTRSGAAEL